MPVSNIMKMLGMLATQGGTVRDILGDNPGFIFLFSGSEVETLWTTASSEEATYARGLVVLN